MHFLTLGVLLACSGTHERSLPTIDRVTMQPSDDVDDAAAAISEDAGSDAIDAADQTIDAAMDTADASADAESPSEPDARATGCAIDRDAPPIEHSGNITSDETWGPGLHLIRFLSSIRATLTILPCARVRVRAGQGIEVRAEGRLIAEGSAAQPIRFEPETAAAGWSGLVVQPGGNVRLAHATLSGAGASNSASWAALVLRGTFERPTVRVQHVAIEDARTFGAWLESGALFTLDSSDLTIRGAADFPVITDPGSAGSLPSGTYTGNARDEILIVSGTILHDMTLRDLGVPYHVGMIGNRNTKLRVAISGSGNPSGPVPVLTIEGGARLRFEPAAIMEIENFTGPGPASGALRVLGAEREVLFTSAATPQAPGDWVGIWFGGVPDPRNLIEGARIEYAGGVTGASSHGCENPGAPPDQRHRDQAAVLIMGPPASAFVRGTTIAHSASGGIEQGYVGAPFDFVTNNDFEDIAWCLESYPRPISGTCPMPVPCPR